MVNLSDLSGGGSSGGSSSGTVVGNNGYGDMTKPAKYYHISSNQSQGSYQLAFYDQDFGTMIPQYDQYNDQSYKDVTNNVNVGNSTFQNYQMFFWNSWTSTASSGPSSNSGFYMGALWASTSMVGHGAIHAFANGSMRGPNINYANKVNITKGIFNSDHSDKGVVYVCESGYIRCYSVMDIGQSGPQAPGTKEFVIPSADGTAFNTNMRGSASYNNTRKELLIFSNVGNMNDWKVYYYKGIDFDTYPSPQDAFSNATSATWFNVQGSNYSNNTTSHKHQCQPVLHDDGTASLFGFDPQNALRCHTFTPPTDGTSLAAGQGGTQQTLVHQANCNTTTSYGFEQGNYYGMNMVQSTDGKAVSFSVPYYYYGTGCCLMVTNKRSNTGGRSVQQSTDSSYGRTIVPYRDDSVVMVVQGNWYAGNYSSNYVMGCHTASPIAANGITYTSGFRKYFPIAPAPNTTNYTGFGMVNDYCSYNYSDFK